MKPGQPSKGSAGDNTETDKAEPALQTGGRDKQMPGSNGKQSKRERGKERQRECGHKRDSRNRCTALKGASPKMLSGGKKARQITNKA